MKNPLVLFVGAAVVAVAALAGATADRWRDWPGPVQPSAASPDVEAVEAAGPVGEPQSKLPPPAPETAEPSPGLRGGQPAETAAGPAPQEPDEQVPAGGPDEIESPENVGNPEPLSEAPVAEPTVAPEAPTGDLTGDLATERGQAERLAAVDAREAQPAAPRAPAKPDAEPEAAAQPSFDVVRLEEDGSLIVAGLAAPGANVTLLLDGEAIASDAANEVGAWLLMPDAPLPPGSHQLMVQARDADSGAQTSGAIAVAVPDRAADRPRVAHSAPVQPFAAEEDVAAAPEPAELEEPARLAPEEPSGREAEEEKVALAPVRDPDVEAEAPVAREADPEPEEYAAVAPETEVDLEPEPEIGRRDIPLALETVDYNEDGEIVFSGRADPGSLVRINVDNRSVGETTVDADGRWRFAGGDHIAPGRHTLRADLMGADGNVVGRIILPFVHADGREVAALVESRRGAMVQREPEVETPEPAEPVAEPEASVAAEEVAPEPKPEAPVVAKEVAPEPEPEAPVAAEEIAPEPEPEAPVVVGEVAPEPEPEAPVAAEEIAPEPEPEAPVAAEEIVPELEPEAPVAAEEIAPEPEPEAPVVVGEVAPEPEPEAPVAAEEIAPEPEPEAPVAAEEIVPELEPEAPVAADEIAPEPEPEAPVVVGEVAPEPEPEAPVAAEEIAPEPEPEAPVAAEEIVPELEPEAPVAAEEIAPEPEPEAPVVVGEVAPEPEPEAPVAAEEIAPEPEPEAPVAAEEIAPEPEPEEALTDRAEPEPVGRVAAVEPDRIEPGDAEPEAAVARPGHVVIQPGNNLWRISRVIYGRGIEYTAIYEANRDKISDPDLIYPGQIFATPGVDPPVEIDPEWREPLSEDDLARQDAAE